MKKLLILLLISAAIACQQKSAKDEPTTITGVYTKEDSSLVDKAKMFFKVLPKEATGTDNQVTDAKVKLGQVLFYDTRLSKTGNNSCNSCHNLSAYGVDNLSTSKGDEGKNGNRNSPTVFNAALHNMQFWDGRAATIEEQAGMPILNPIEMAIPHKGFLVNRLHKDTVYHKLFVSAFPGEAEPVSFANVRNAIGAFERTLLTPSRFDKYMEGDLSALTAQEKTGLSLFLDSGCATCHNGIGVGGGTLQKFGLFTDYRTLTNSHVDDQGRLKVTGVKSDKDVFKVPGLRNVEKTYPYFHDGSIASLDSTIDIMAKSQLNKNLTGEEVKDIVAFLKTMTGDIREEAKQVPEEVKAVLSPKK
jgi:cytochrome c peroxidase